MYGFLDSLLHRSLDAGPAIRPRAASRFERPALMEPVAPLIAEGEPVDAGDAATERRPTARKPASENGSMPEPSATNHVSGRGEGALTTDSSPATTPVTSEPASRRASRNVVDMPATPDRSAPREGAPGPPPATARDSAPPGDGPATLPGNRPAARTEVDAPPERFAATPDAPAVAERPAAASPSRRQSGTDVAPGRLAAGLSPDLPPVAVLRGDAVDAAAPAAQTRHEPREPTRSPPAATVRAAVHADRPADSRSGGGEAPPAAAANEAPTVEITIDRVDVVARTPEREPPRARRAEPRRPAMGLDAYLKQRNAGER